MPPWAAVRQPSESPAEWPFYGSAARTRHPLAKRASPCKLRCGSIVTNGRNPLHIFEYFGPPPPSGGTQVMFRLGSLMSQVLQWTQFCALITKRGLPFSSTHSLTPAGQYRLDGPAT